MFQGCNKVFIAENSPISAIMLSSTAMMRLMSHSERTLKCALSLLTKKVIINHQAMAPRIMPV